MRTRRAQAYPIIRYLSVDNPLHHRNLLLRQPIQLIHQRIDLPVRGLDLAAVRQ